MSESYRSTMPRYLSRQDVAIMFDTTPRTVDRWVAQGLLESVKVGPKFVRIPLTSIEEFITKAEK